MAECSYARCVQQRRNIRRELQRWTRNMVHIVGLERIAEELMGRRKWKLYQESSMSRSYLQPLNNNVKNPTISSEQDYYLGIKESAEAPLHIANNHHYYAVNNHNPKQHNSILSKDIITSASTTTTTTTTNEDDGGGGDGSILASHTKENENEGIQGASEEGGAVTPEDTDAEDRLKDWTPPTKCYFCVDGKLDSEHIAHGVLSPRHSDSDSTDSHSDNEAPPSLTPTGSLLNNHHRPNNHRPRHPVAPTNMATIESATSSMAALAAVFSGGGGSSPGATTAPHLPFYAPNMFTHNWYLANVARSFQAERDGDQKGAASPAAPAGEQPLDLSKGGGGPSANTPPNGPRLPTIDTKHIFKAKPRMSTVAGRRTYTEDELQAALRDIQSGKLGTRRAAVIYGIPRSTLRNKVYKLALERERESHLSSATSLGAAASLKLAVDDEEAMDDDKELSGAEEEKEVEKALDAPLCDILRVSKMEIPPDALKAILQKSKEGAVEGWPGAADHSEVGPYIQSLLVASQQLMAGRKDLDLAMVMSRDDKSHFTSLVMNELANQSKQNNGDTNSSEKLKHQAESDMETDEAPSNVILKIPSFKPTTSKNGCDMFKLEGGINLASPSAATTSESGSPPILPPSAAAKAITIKDVKDVIAHTISQKFQQNLSEPRRPPILELDFKRYTPPLAKPPPDLGRAYPPKPPPPSAAGGKGTRPKRGKYRNYDRDSLVEAVRAVQRGEMSVHRAGSYYGVPHSTLEYKVKERHLMRPRKRDPKPNPVDEKIASLKQNDVRLASADKLLKPALMKPPQKYPPTSPNGMKLSMFEGPPGMGPLPGYNAPPFPFWPHPSFHHLPMEYGGRGAAAPPFTPNPDFFATQMMQKLQEESARVLPAAATSPRASPALVKSARQIAESLLDGTGSNGSFLDGIIRSSLESGVPHSEDKSPVKEVGVESMSNKALLDQLCRNGRLTPLSKPPRTPEANSSGDEGNSPLYLGGDADVVHATIELSNDSNAESDTASKRGHSREEVSSTSPTPSSAMPRIYLKKDLANPDNLQPEMLMRFRDMLPDIERNGGGLTITNNEPNLMTTGSASDNDAPQD